MTTGADIMVAVGRLLNDEQHTRWKPSELCGWINDGYKAIVLAKPSAKASTRVLSLTAGTLQLIPAVSGQPTPLQLINVTRNIVSEGPPRVGGRVITVIGEPQMSASDPYWQDPTRNPYKKEVRHVMFDEQNPLEFSVFPGNLGTGKVEAVVSAVPTTLVVDSGEDVDDATKYTAAIDLPEIYDPVLIDYVLYRTQSKDDPGLAGRAGGAFQAFASQLGIKIQVEGGSSPNARRGKP